MFDLLILRNCVFRLRNEEMWLVLSWKVVVLLIFTNPVFKLQNVQISLCRTGKVSICCFSALHFQVSNLSDICEPSCKRFVFLNFTKCGQGSKRWNFCSAVQQWSWYADAQETRFLAEKRWEMCSAVMKVLRFADTQESCFEARKRSHMGCPALLYVDLLNLRNCVFRLRNDQLWLLRSWKVVVLLIFTKSVFKLQNVQVWTVSNCKGVYLLIVRHCIFRSRIFQIFVNHPTRDSFSWSSRNVVRVRNVEICAVLSSNEVDLLMLKKRVFGRETIRNEQCSNESSSICWYSGIVFWGLEKFTYVLFRPAMWSICWFLGIVFSDF